MRKAIRYVVKVRTKFVQMKFMRVIRGYYAVCSHCGYSGNDWPESGECPACGEVN